MAKTAEQSYQEIADVLSDVTPAGWVKTYVEADIIDDHAKIICKWEDQAGRKKGFSPGIEGVDRIYEALDQIRLIMSADNKRWKKVTYCLSSNGKFSLDYIY